MGVGSLCMSRVVRVVVAFLVIDLLVYSAFVLHPSYSAYVEDIISHSKKVNEPPQEPILSTPGSSSTVPAHPSPSDAAPERPSKAKSTQTAAQKASFTKTPLATPHFNATNKWIFDTERDSDDWRLSSEQCDEAFPGLFTEIDRAVDFQTKKGTVTPEDIDISWKKDGAVRAQIIDQKVRCHLITTMQSDADQPFANTFIKQLYILEAKIHDNDHPRMRAIAILSAINRAITTSPSPIPDIEFSFVATDIADEEHLQRTIWALSRLPSEEETWVMSDFGYWSWAVDLIGGYEDIRKQISALETDYNLKKKEVVWRGARKTNPMRENLIRGTEGKTWADVESVDWRDASHVKSVEAISIPEHCGYQFVLQTEGMYVQTCISSLSLIHILGRSYSGRLKYLQNCNSVVIIPKRNWVEPHHALLVSSGPDQNFVEIEEDFSDLEDRVLALLANPEKARRIAQNGVETFRDRVLTPAAQNCYWRKMLNGWSEVSFDPVAADKGVSFETFM